MTRVLLSSVFFLTAFIFETSFLSSLPWIFGLIPFVFALGIYLIQHQGLSDGFFWIVAYGVLLWLLHLNASPISAFAYPLCAWVGWLSARHIFSNRSFYGVVACGIIGMIPLMIVDAGLLFFSSLSTNGNELWGGFFQYHGWRILLLMLLTLLLFRFSRITRLYV